MEEENILTANEISADDFEKSKKRSTDHSDSQCL